VLKKIVVTGGAGFIGSHTVVQLLERGFEPVIVDDFSNSERGVLDGLAAITGRRLACHELDCRDREGLSAVFAEYAPVAGVIHFAAAKLVGEGQQRPLHYYSNNLGSLFNVVEVMLAHGVRDLVFSSSCTVYGQPDALPVTEATPPAPAASVYGATKQSCEQVLRDVIAADEPLRVMLLRYFNPIGAHPSGEIGELPLGDPQNLIPVILQSVAGLRGPVQIFGDDWSTPDGTCIRDYIHVLDLADAHVASLDWMAAQPPVSLLETLNIGTGRGQSVLEAIESFERATGESVERRMAPRRDGDIEQIWAACEKAEELLGWRATRSIDDAMRDAWSWQQRLAART
jgi:UDP-glucose 4-epimerase